MRRRRVQETLSQLNPNLENKGSSASELKMRNAENSQNNNEFGLTDSDSKELKKMKDLILEDTITFQLPEFLMSIYQRIANMAHLILIATFKGNLSGSEESFKSLGAGNIPGCKENFRSLGKAISSAPDAYHLAFFRVLFFIAEEERNQNKNIKIFTKEKINNLKKYAPFIFKDTPEKRETYLDFYNRNSCLRRLSPITLENLGFEEHAPPTNNPLSFCAIS